MTRQHDDLRASLELRSTDELVSILRDRDAGEWRPEVFALVESILVARGVSIADVTAPEPNDTGVEGASLVTIGRFMNPVAAHAARHALESAGIAAWVIDDGLGSIAQGPRLQVQVDDEPAAAEILKAEPDLGGIESPEWAEPACPRCGSATVRPVAEHADPERPQFVRLGTRVLRKWWYDCAACGHRWPDEDA